GHGVHATADADQLGVVVFTGQGRRFDAPGQRAAGAGDLVSGDLLAVARPAQHDAQAVRVGHGACRGGDTEGGVVVFGVVAEGTAIDRLVPGFIEVVGDLLLELESGVVRAEVDAHARNPYTAARRAAGGDRAGSPPDRSSRIQASLCGCARARRSAGRTRK